MSVDDILVLCGDSAMREEMPPCMREFCVSLNQPLSVALNQPLSVISRLDVISLLRSALSGVNERHLD